MRKSSESKAKSEAETIERSSDWAKANDKDKAEIARISEEAR